MKSVMSHNFAQIAPTSTPRSSFNRSRGYKTTFDAGYLVPVFFDEALPGDTYSVNMASFARLSTPIVPFMDNMFLDSFFFAVPLRLVWDNFQKFMGEQIDPGDTTDFLVPQMVSPAVTGYQYPSLSGYFGIPTGVPGLSHSSLWHRAYNLIWNNWFRDENLQDSLTVDKGDGPDSPANYVLKRRGKRHDYFTSCLPWPQKGTAVTVPLGSQAPVTGIGKGNQTWLNGAATVYETGKSGTTVYPANDNTVIDSGNTSAQFVIQEDPNNPGFPGIFADLSEATSSTINALRQAFALQRLYEKDARGGSRYTEIIRSHFGVISADARLQRPEYLGGASVPISINPIAQTSSTDGTTPQGNLAAMGTVSHSGAGFVKSFDEHCIIIGMVSVRADLNYQQGLQRMWSRRTRWDFYWPELAHIGEQAVLNKEIYAQGSANPTQDELPFGYNERYAEYRYAPSLITGKFNSTDSSPLDIWHLGQEFVGLPVLNSSFIEEDPPVDRVVAVPAEPHMLFDSHFNVKCARPIPTYSIPGMGGKL